MDPDAAFPSSKHGCVPNVRRIAALLRPGWMVLSGGSIGGVAPGDPVEVGVVLLHPHVGVALLDLSTLPGRAAAPEDLLAALEAAGFPERFGDFPPVVCLRASPGEVASLGRRLDRAFDWSPPIALRGGDTWARAVQDVIGPAEAVCRGGVAQASPHRWPGAETLASSRPGTGGARGLALFWGAVFLTLSGGAAVLQHLGPPTGRLSAAAAASSESAEGIARVQATIEAEPTTGPNPGSRSGPGNVPVQAGQGSHKPTAGSPRAGATEVGHGPREPPPEASAPQPSLVALLRELGDASTEDDGEAVLVSSASQDDGPGARPWPGAADGKVGVSDLSQKPHPRPAAPPNDAEVHRPVVAGGLVGPAQSGHKALEVSAGPEATVAILDSPSIGSTGLGTEALVTGMGQEPSRSALGGAAMAALSPTLLEALVRRGDAMLEAGDISAARLLYERAAAAGSGRAAAAAARTYDPAVLAGMGAGIQGNVEAAAALYQRALALGYSRGPASRNDYDDR